MSYKEAKKLAEKGATITMVIIDSLYNRHEFYYSKDKFPDKNFSEFCAYFWYHFADNPERSLLKFY